MLLVESIKRLYKDNKISEEKLNELVGKGTISEKEKRYILGKEEIECIRY